MKISIVSPVYNAEKIIIELVNRICEEIILTTKDYEIILIDDYSSDNSWETIKSIAKVNLNVKAIKLSRNFGQHMAIKAGLELAKGECCIVMDCDLQDDPKYITNLIEKWEEGFDVVYTQKSNRNHSWLKNITARGFNIIFNWLAENKKVNSLGQVGSFSLISKKVVDAFNSYNDYQFHYLMVLRWLGFKSCYIPIEHKERYEGKSSYSLKKLLRHAIVGVVYQTDKLLRMSIYMGFVFSLISIVLSIFLVINYFVSGPQPGWTSLIVVILFSSGLILIAIGILGIYIGKTFEQTKNRPRFIIDEKINL
jgi:polyisoprenyl-phosphate glycosyltransferase